MYGHNPLRIDIIKSDGSSRSQVGLVVGTRLDLNLMVALGLWDRLEVGLALPLVSSTGYQGSALTSANLSLTKDGLRSFSLGDVRLVPKYNLVNLDEGMFALAVVPMLVLPSAAGAPYAGQRGVTFMPMVAMSSRLKDLRLGLDLGFRWRKKINLLRRDRGPQQRLFGQ